MPGRFRWGAFLAWLDRFRRWLLSHLGRPGNGLEQRISLGAAQVAVELRRLRWTRGFPRSPIRPVGQQGVNLSKVGGDPSKIGGWRRSALRRRRRTKQLSTYSSGYRGNDSNNNNDTNNNTDDDENDNDDNNDTNSNTDDDSNNNN